MSIHIKGAREHNLKHLELRIPRDQLVVITGISGSGKSSLAFDTLYAEGYRKYIESLSVKARQILDQIGRPDVDYIHGLSPVIAIEQRASAGNNPRSTVATVTEIANYAALLWAFCSKAYCPLDGGRIERRTLDDCIERILEEPEGSRCLLLAPLFTVKPTRLRDELPYLRQRGFQRVRVAGEIKNLDDPDSIDFGSDDVAVELVIDRLVLKADQRSRIADSLELAFQEGKDRALVLIEDAGAWRELALSRHLSCGTCDAVYEPLTPRHFSYNSPEGACTTCGGLGYTLQFQDELLVPDPKKSVKAGALKPWRIGSKNMIIRRSATLRQLAEQLPFDPKIPWRELDPETRKILIYGAGERCFTFRFGRGKAVRSPFKGVMADLQQSFRETKSEGLRARLTAYQTHSVCPDCKGKRLRPYTSAALLEGKRFTDFMALSVAEAFTFTKKLKPDQYVKVKDALEGLEQRLHFLDKVGLGYLALDRQYPTLSGGEAQRVRLATQLGLGLVGVIYVLDEPSVGLHPQDIGKLIALLCDLRDRGNTVIVVEHDAETMRCADHLIELGPAAGHEGGHIVFQGTLEACLKARTSLTGPYISGKAKVGKKAAACAARQGWLTVYGAVENNLKQIDVRFPVGLMTVVCGVSGSGKSTLVNDILAKAAAFRLNRAKVIPGRHTSIEGLAQFSSAVRVDQSPVGTSPRSNPATYVKLFDRLRNLFARCPLSKMRGYTATRFSFNTIGGRCERCKGDGQIKLDMQFLADVYVDCPSCRGRRYNRETLEVRFKGLNIAEVLDLTVDEALNVFKNQPNVVKKLATLQSVGLGYLKLGQPSNTLSGGEAQRIKLSLELSKSQEGGTLYILDEPTTGLHWIDIQKLMDLLFRLRDAGNTIIVIEHQLDVINLADYVVELGPKGGSKGGYLTYGGPRKGFETTQKSPTGRCLKRYLS